MQAVGYGVLGCGVRENGAVECRLRGDEAVGLGARTGERLEGDRTAGWRLRI